MVQQGTRGTVASCPVDPHGKENKRITTHALRSCTYTDLPARRVHASDLQMDASAVRQTGCRTGTCHRTRRPGCGGARKETVSRPRTAPLLHPPINSVSALCGKGGRPTCPCFQPRTWVRVQEQLGIRILYFAHRYLSIYRDTQIGRYLRCCCRGPAQCIAYAFEDATRFLSTVPSRLEIMDATTGKNIFQLFDIVRIFATSTRQRVHYSQASTNRGTV